jgi:hypothetical protein
LLCDQETTGIEGIGVVAEHHKEEEREREGRFDVSLDACDLGATQVLVVVEGFSVFLAESLHHSDSIKGLFGIASTLTIRFQILTEAALDGDTNERSTEEKKGEGE